MTRLGNLKQKQKPQMLILTLNYKESLHCSPAMDALIHKYGVVKSQITATGGKIRTSNSKIFNWYT